MMKKWAISLITAFLISTQVMAQQAYVEGVDYRAIPTVVKTSHPEKVVVTEIFWYGCGHCFSLEDEIASWSSKLPADVAFSRIPAMFGKSWVIHAQLYYMGEVLGITGN